MANGKWQMTNALASRQGGANYGEARAASSQADFIHHLSIVLRELNETQIWLRMILKSEIVKAERLSDLINENGQLCRIFTASIKTARADLSFLGEMENGK